MRPPSTGTDCGQNADRTHTAGSCRRQRLTSPPPERLRKRGGQNALRRNTHEDRRDAPPWGPPQNPVTPEKHPTTRNASRLPHRGVRPTARRRRDAVQRPSRPALVPAHIIVKPGTKTDRVGRHPAVPERNTPSRSVPQFHPSSGLQLRSPAPPPTPSGLRPDPSWVPTREPTAAGESRFFPRCSRSGRCCPAARGAAAWHARG